MVEVSGDRPPAPAAVVDAGGHRRFAEAVLPRGQVELVAVAQRLGAGARVHRGQVPVEAAVAVEVAEGAAHAHGAGAGAGGRGQVAEEAPAFVAEVARGAVVAGDQQLRVAVAVHVHEGGREPPHLQHALLQRRPERRRGEVDEAPAFVAEQAVAGVILVAGHEQIQVAVQVVIAERGAHAVGPRRRGNRHSGRGRNLLEDGNAARHLLVPRRRGRTGQGHASVAVQAVRAGAARAARFAQAGDVQILPAVAVEVAHRRRQAAVGERHPRRGGVVAEGAVAAVEVERVHRPAAAEQEQILPAVAIEVAHRGAAGHVRHRMVERAPLGGQPGAQPRAAKAQLGARRRRARGRQQQRRRRRHHRGRGHRWR